MRLLDIVKCLYKNPAYNELRKQKANPEKWNKLITENKRLIKELINESKENK